MAEKANQDAVRLKTEKISQSDVTEEFLQQMAGTTPINSIPQDGSVTRAKLGTNYNYAGVLTTHDLDTITNTGTYITVDATGNRPSGANTTALLHVMSNDAGTYCSQLYQDLDGKVYTRFRSMNYSGFTGWTPLSNLPLNGKKVVNFGDSIFGSYESPTSISAYIGSKTGATVYNVGFGGCRMGWHYDPWDAFSMYRLADAVSTGDFSRQDQAIINGSGTLLSYFSNHLATLKGIDFNTVDYITISYGTNDWFSDDIILDSPLNRLEISTYKGALRYSLEKLLSSFPHLKIMILTPIFRTMQNETDNSDNYAHKDLYLTDFVQGAIDVAKEYHVPCLDNYYELGFNKFNRWEYFPDDDGIHPNVLGRQKIGEKVGSALISKF
jgi:lysophospholipase L1-like esterase